MILSKSVEYALKSLILIKYQSSNINVTDISSKLDIPKSYTSKLLQTLVKKDYISSQKGPGGGFRPNNYTFTIKDLIIDIDGEFKYDRCVMGLSNCSNDNPCPLHEHFRDIKSTILCDFMELTIEKICENPDKVLKL